MRPAEPDGEASALGFVELVRSRFSFLRDLGFDVVREEPGRVRFASPDVFVDVFRSPRGHDLGFEVGQAAAPADRLSQLEMLTVAGVGPLPLLRPESDAELSRDVAELADRLREHGGRALAGDDAVYEAAKELRRVYTQQYVKRQPDGG